MTNLGNADEEWLLRVLDSPVILLSVVLHVGQLLSVPPLELVGGIFVPGDLVNSVGFVVVTGIRKNYGREVSGYCDNLTGSSRWLQGQASRQPP